MAEVVERNLEDSVGEILYIRKAKLFNKMEVNEIVRKRRQHEYSLQKRNKRILDYDAYINTEMIIMKLLRFRRQITNDSRYVDKIEKSIISRLVRLHRQLCYRFQSHIDLWMRFIHFCKIIGRHLSVLRIWNNVLKIHGRTEPRLWIAAAAYHLHHGVRSEARADLRNFAKQKEELVKTRKRLRNEYITLDRHASKAEKQTINEIMEELKENQISLDEAAKEMVKEQCLTWDRAHLNAIRQARHLLTEGISLNPECDLLHLELAKLEINALDFFRTRVLPRYKNRDIDSANESLDITLKGSSKKKLKPLEKKAIENKEFMSLITEDVELIANGGAVNLVIDSLLSRWINNSKMLEALYKILSSVPQTIDSNLVEKVANYLNNAKELEISESIKEKDSAECKTQGIQSTLSNQLVEIHETMMNKGVEAVINLWNSWYLPSSRNLSQTSSFRIINPSFPEAVGLLRARLTALTLYSDYEINGKSSPTAASNSIIANEDDTEFHDTYQQRRQFLSSEVTKSRELLDLLATSQWGSHCPGNFLLFFIWTHFYNCSTCNQCFI
ncbi:U3 small nucleolar rna associated protein 6 [Schistosoma japonicum]|nr:U3 small nucleolar rna associated protein 6 [Schistosoma japonicum]